MPIAQHPSSAAPVARVWHAHLVSIPRTQSMAHAPVLPVCATFSSYPFLTHRIAASSITVTSPTASSVYSTGSNYTITWVSTGVSANVTITLQIAGESYPYLTLASNIANTGSFVWMLQTNLLPPGQYWILVSTGTVTHAVYGAAPAAGSFVVQTGCLIDDPVLSRNARHVFRSVYHVLELRLRHVLHRIWGLRFLLLLHHVAKWRLGKGHLQLLSAAMQLYCKFDSFRNDRNSFSNFISALPNLNT